MLPGVATLLTPVRTVARELTLRGGSGRRARRAWVGHGRAHLEVRGSHLPERERLRDEVVGELSRLPGVHWAEVNEVLGRVVVAFDDGQLDLDDLVEVVEGVEETHELAQERFPTDRAEHPGDREPLDRQLVALGADALGISVGAVLKVARSAPLSTEVASLLALVDASPRLRRELENVIGRATADVGLALASAVAQGLAQGPTGLLADATHRGVMVREILARRAAWHRREPELHGLPGRGPGSGVPYEPRPVPLPAGPVERHADRAAVAGLAATATALAATRDWRPAVAALAASTPRAARLGREAYAAHLGVVLAARDVVAMDSEVLRRLDRIDTIVLDADLLMGRAWAATAVMPLDGDLRADVSAHARALLDPRDPTAPASRGRWRLRPLVRDEERDPVVRAAARAVRRPGCRLLLLTRSGAAVAVVAAERALDPLAETLVATARHAADLVVGGASYGVAARLHVSATVAGGTALRRSVRELQESGRVVLVVSGREAAALAASDCGIGVLREGEQPPWGAHVLCGPGLGQAARLLSALRPAARASSLGVTLATYGSGVGAILALAGPRRDAAARAMLGVNAASVASIATGVYLARQVGLRPDPIPVDITPWHELDRDAALRALGSGQEGLSAQEAQARLRRRPPDDEEETPTVVGASLEELANPLTPALAGGAGLSAVGGSVTDAVLIGSVMSVNALLGGLQRVGAQRALRKLVDVSAVRVKLLRGGEDTTVTADHLVDGDLITVEAGDAVPADARIIEAAGVEVDESSLTGESQLVRKMSSPVASAALADRRNMLYEGTTVAAGRAVGVVVATGPGTEVGRAARAAAGPRRPGGVQARLQKLTAATVPLALGAGVGLVGAGLLRGVPINRTLGTGVSLAVAAVPEGLPIVAGLAQLSAAKRLARQGALVRSSSTVETLGRVDVLCFDKTGTLTEGRMSLHAVWPADAAERGPEGRGPGARAADAGAAGTPLSALDDAGRAVLAAGLRATPQAKAGGRLPHPTDRAVLRAARHADVTPDAEVASWQPAAELPFESARGFHAVLGTTSAGPLISVKGAPEIVLPRCSDIRRAAASRPLDDEARARVEDEVEQLARHGFRVLAVAERDASGRGDLDDERVGRLGLVGLLAFSDPVRASAAAAVRGVLEAGVRVVMLTGDHPSTAEAIAAELGILDGTVVTGSEVDRRGDDELAELLARGSVFARVSPEHKVRIVRVLQDRGRVVAVTGDGANDAPAIRLADVGVALGRRGTNAAKEAADLVVTDDALETIIAAIVEGRATWTSVRDAVGVLLGGNLGEIGFTVATGLLPGGPALNARQLLLVNLLTDLLPSTALAVRPPRSRSPEDLLREGPDASLGQALVRDVLIRGALTAAAAGGGWAAARVTGTAGRASTVALVALVGAQLGQTAVLGLHSPLVLGASVVSAAALAGIVATPGVSHFFGSRPLGPVGWTIGLTAAGTATAASLLVPAVVRWALPEPTVQAPEPSAQSMAQPRPSVATLPAPRQAAEPESGVHPAAGGGDAPGSTDA
ncbi:MAG TPA: HAD-IC family P-type ATPase [Actinomycetes bacterium]